MVCMHKKESKETEEKLSIAVSLVKANKKIYKKKEELMRTGIIKLCVQKEKYYTGIRIAFDSNQINEVSFNKLYSGLIWNY